MSKPVLSKKACPELAVALSVVEGVVEGSKDSNVQMTKDPKLKTKLFQALRLV